MSDSNGTDPSTQVSVVRCAWVPVTMSYHVRNLMLLLPEDSAPSALLGLERFPGVTAGDPGTYSTGSHRGSIVDREVMKSCLSTAIAVGGRTGMDHS
jgi:hypothetical protein